MHFIKGVDELFYKDLRGKTAQAHLTRKWFPNIKKVCRFILYQIVYFLFFNFI